MDIHDNIDRVSSHTSSCAQAGYVRWSPFKSLWYLSHLSIALAFGLTLFTWSGFLVFVVFTALTLCLGHSLGMHRRLIHKSYQCPQWLEYVFVYLGVLVGMAGPKGMIRQHDLRDWAQRQSSCHAYLRHGKSFWCDAWWQLHCDLELMRSPNITLESKVDDDSVYAFMDSTWPLQQLPWAMLLFYWGGPAWVVWGVSVRIVTGVTGHWLVGYFAHNTGLRSWHVRGAAVQGYNIPWAGFISMGEAWHNNHHAYPGSAKLGLETNQPDPGWWILCALKRLGLAWNIVLPEQLPHRSELSLLADSGSQITVRRQ